MDMRFVCSDCCTLLYVLWESGKTEKKLRHVNLIEIEVFKVKIKYSKSKIF